VYLYRKSIRIIKLEEEEAKNEEEEEKEKEEETHKFFLTDWQLYD